MRFMGLTLSEQSYTRYLEGKLRETFGFSGTPEAECFSGCPQYLVSFCSDNVSSKMAGGLVPTCET